jgi:hypothetical protein
MSAFDLTPEDEAEVDREIRIARLRRELEDLAGGSFISGSIGDVPDDLEEAFLTRACEFEKAPQDTNFNRLIQRGLNMPPPPELDDTSLSSHLQHVISALATLSCFLYDTDHLSDRELYAWLWAEGLREETPDLSTIGGAWHLSPIGSGTEEDMTIYLSYYASEQERRRWQREFPHDRVPPRCAPPYNRDRYLPRPD